MIQINYMTLIYHPEVDIITDLLIWSFSRLLYDMINIVVEL